MILPRNIRVEFDREHTMWPPTWSHIQRYRWFWAGPFYVTWTWERKGARYF